MLRWLGGAYMQGSLKSPPEMGYISVMNLETWARPCGGPSAGDEPPCRKNSAQIRAHIMPPCLP
jgi:hypothetical protein